MSSALSFAKSLDSGKVGEALSRLVRDDPTLKQHTDEETKETILSGMGELHLEISMEKLRRALNIPQSDPQIQLGKLAGFQMWGAARGQADLIRDFGATPIDYDKEDFTRVLPGGFDVVFDGIGEDGYRRSFAALKPGGLLIAIGFSAGVQARQGMLAILASIARMYLWRFLPGGKRARFYSITAAGRKQLVAERGRWDRLVESMALVLAPDPTEG